MADSSVRRPAYAIVYIPGIGNTKNFNNGKLVISSTANNTGVTGISNVNAAQRVVNAEFSNSSAMDTSLSDWGIKTGDKSITITGKTVVGKSTDLTLYLTSKSYDPVIPEGKKSWTEYVKYLYTQAPK